MSKPNGYTGIFSTHKYWGKKPPELYRNILNNFSVAGGRVVDPFMGSGVLGRVCKEDKRCFVGSDINPSALNIAQVFVSPPSYGEVKAVLDKVSALAEEKIRNFYITADGDEVTHLVRENESVKEVWVKDKNRMRLKAAPLTFANENLTLVNPNFLSKALSKNSRINVKENESVASLFTKRALKAIEILCHAIHSLDGNEKKIGLYILTSAAGQMSKMVFAIKRRRKSSSDARQYEVGSWVIGYWKPKLFMEINVWRVFEGRAKKLLKAVENSHGGSLFDAESPEIFLLLKDGFRLLDETCPNSVDLIVTDPPHNDRIPYLELSDMWNALIGESPCYEDEWVLSNAAQRGKDKMEYHAGLSSFFELSAQALKDDGKLVLMFNTKDEEVWDLLRTLPRAHGLAYHGRFPGEYSAQSVVQDSRKGALKHDWCLVYSKKKKLNLKQGRMSGWVDA